MAYQGNLEVINRVKRPVFSDTLNNDIALYTLSNNQRIFIGTGSTPSIVSASSNILLNTNATINGNLIPLSNETFDLGSSIQRFRDLYLGGNSLFIANTKISTDSNSNIRIQDSTTNTLRSLTLKEIQLGDSPNAIKLKQDTNGKYKFFTLSNNIETPDRTLNGSVALSNTGQSIGSTTPDRGYAASLVTVPSITTKAIPNSASITYGRIELGAHNGSSLAPNASMQITINHNLGTPNYLAFVYPDDTTSIQTRISNYTMNSIDITFRNISSNALDYPCANYQLVMSMDSIASTTTTIAAPVNITSAEIPLSVESTASSFASTFTLSNLATDPQSYPITLSIHNNDSNRFTLDPATMTLTYIHSNTSTSAQLVLKAKNQYVDDNTKLITITANETRI